ncbi:apolipoprotein F [Varanus komodoensis]|nr:apolipoprotein F [Varanus komodoensis]
MRLPPLAIAATFFVLLLDHTPGGHLLPVAGARGSAPEAHQSTSISSHALPTLLSSISSKSLQFQLPSKGVSCEDLMPDALDDFDSLPQAAQIFIRAALALALQSSGCSQHAETAVLQLYKVVGQEDADAILFMLVGAFNAIHSPDESKKSAALDFNLDQLASPQAWHCHGLMQVDGALLYGQVHRTYSSRFAAAAACHRLGDSCAGVASNGTSFFQVVGRAGSYFLPHDGAHSWLHKCHRLARVQRSTGCFSAKEQNVHSVLEWVPGVSTYYNFGTSIYFAIQGCTHLAKERAIEGAMDLGYDALISLTGGVGGIGTIGGFALKPLYKIGVRNLASYFSQGEDSYSVPSNYSGPVVII